MLRSPYCITSNKQINALYPPMGFSHILFGHWSKKNDAYCIEFCRTSERMLAELGFEITTP